MTVWKQEILHGYAPYNNWITANFVLLICHSYRWRKVHSIVINHVLQFDWYNWQTPKDGSYSKHCKHYKPDPPSVGGGNNTLPANMCQSASWRLPEDTLLLTCTSCCYCNLTQVEHRSWTTGYICPCTQCTTDSFATYILHPLTAGGRICSIDTV